jgi:glutaredoxin
MKGPRAIHIVYATWCPHCVPITVVLLAKRGEELGIPCRLYDIDTEAVAEADRLVKEYGDWDPDYLVPQVFLEYDNGRIEHVMTGNPQGVALTKMAVEELLSRGPLAMGNGSVPK